MESLKIGWGVYGEKFLAVYESPAPLRAPKDPSKTSNGFLSCPAVRAVANGMFVVSAPFSLKLRFVKGEESNSIAPVYPFTTLVEPLVSQMVSVEPPSTWRDGRFAVVQIPSPYVFIADEPILIEQLHPMLTNQSTFNWRVVPGSFDIFAWQRPLNWAFEWDTHAGDFEIRTGEAQYCLRFIPQQRLPGDYQIELVQHDLDGPVKKRLMESAGVTGVRRGTTQLMKKAAIARNGKKFID